MECKYSLREHKFYIFASYPNISTFDSEILIECDMIEKKNNNSSLATATPEPVL